MLQFSFKDNVWKIDFNNKIVELKFYKKDEKEDLVLGNICSSLLLNGETVAFLLPSDQTPVIHNEKDLESLSTLGQYIRIHVIHILLGAMSGDHTNDAYFTDLANVLCGYFSVPQNVDIIVPFADGSWYKEDGPVYLCYIKRMMRNGRTYTSRIRQTSKPGRMDLPHFSIGEIDPIRTFHMASVIEDTDNPQPITTINDGSFPARFNLAC